MRCVFGARRYVREIRGLVSIYFADTQLVYRRRHPPLFCFCVYHTLSRPSGHSSWSTTILEHERDRSLFFFPFISQLLIGCKSIESLTLKASFASVNVTRQLLTYRHDFESDFPGRSQTILFFLLFHRQGRKE